MKCENCRFFDKPYRAFHHGLCHRFPKILNGKGVWVHPPMLPESWCGEYKEKIIQEDVMIGSSQQKCCFVEKGKLE